MARKVVLTGMRTTGSLHLGHYVGALKQWQKVQDEGEHVCYFLLADVQALTTHSDNPALLTRSVMEVALDWLAVGLDPSLPRVHFVLQSQVLERYEISALLSMIARFNEVRMNPTLKAEMEQQKSVSMGFMAYPVDQVADIHMVDPMERDSQLLVPVGEDQVPHLEYARKLARRFNTRYGQVLTPCDALVGEIGRLVGTDGDAKMSKSLGNTINLSDNLDDVFRAIDRMPIDPARAVKGGNRVPGDPEKAIAIIYHRALNPNYDEVVEIEELYRQGAIGDSEIKQRLKEVLDDFLTPIQERRAHIERNADIADIVFDGTQAARRACAPVSQAMREHMHLSYPGGK